MATGQTAAGYTGGYDQTAAAAKPATYATTYTQRATGQQAQAAVCIFINYATLYAIIALSDYLVYSPLPYNMLSC